MNNLFILHHILLKSLLNHLYTTVNNNQKYKQTIPTTINIIQFIYLSIPKVKAYNTQIYILKPSF